MRHKAFLASVILGALLIVGGAGTWLMVSSTLADAKITVADDASCLAGKDVKGPFTAYCEAQIIEHHALDATGGKTYAELGREDPLRAVAQSASFLRASLFTSVVAFGLAAMAIMMGAVFILIGLGMKDVAELTHTE